MATKKATETPVDRWLSTQEFADYIGLSVETIYYWRKKGAGPSGVRIGRYVKYRLSDVDAWIDELQAAQNAS